MNCFLSHSPIWKLQQEPIAFRDQVVIILHREKQKEAFNHFLFSKSLWKEVTTIWSNWLFQLHPSGESDGTPLQHSCLGNSMDGGAWWAAVCGVAKSRTRLSDFTFTFHFHALEKEMATHSSVLAWRIPGTREPCGLPSMGSHRVGHNWSNLAAATPSAWLRLGRCFGATSYSLCRCHFAYSNCSVLLYCTHTWTPQSHAHHS